MKKVHCVDVCLPHVYIYIFTHVHPHAHTRRLVKLSVTSIFPNSFFFVVFFLYFSAHEIIFPSLEKETFLKLKKNGLEFISSLMMVYLNILTAFIFFIFIFCPFIVFLMKSIKTTMLCRPLHVE